MRVQASGQRTAWLQSTLGYDPYFAFCFELLLQKLTIAFMATTKVAMLLLRLSGVPNEKGMS